MTKRDSVAEVLRREILNTGLRPGTPLRQQDVAARLGVSPTPVREAFRVLEAEGYIESRPHRGVVVAKRDYDDVIDAYRLRLALELMAVERLVAHRDAGPVDQLRAITQRGARAMRASEPDAFRRLSIEFHETLSGAAGSALLKQVVDRLKAYWFMFPQDPKRMADAHRDHLAVIAALGKGDATAATAVLHRHLAGNIDRLKIIREKTRAGANGPRLARRGDLAKS